MSLRTYVLRKNVPSLRDWLVLASLPGTNVPGYILSPLAGLGSACCVFQGVILSEPGPPRVLFSAGRRVEGSRVSPPVSGLGKKLSTQPCNRNSRES